MLFPRGQCVNGGNVSLRLLPALLVLAATFLLLMPLVMTSPAQAQVGGQCACPAGSTPLTGTTCLTTVGKHVVPAICSVGHIGQIAAEQQQTSFWGVNQILQQRRDRLQATLVPAGASARAHAYASEDGDSNVLSYADQGRKNDPFGAIVTKAPAVNVSTPAWGVWVQGLGDWEHDDPLSATDIGRFTSTYSVQAGIDRTWQGLAAADDALVFGLVSSYTDSNINYAATTTSAGLTGPGVGLYGEYIRGGFSTDLTSKLDFLNLDQNFGGAAPNSSIGIINAGVNGDVQYKVMLANNNFIEPTTGFALTHTMFQGGATALDLQNASTLRVQGGARAGNSFDLGNGLSVDASLRGLIYCNVLAQNASNSANVFATAITPTDQGLIRGEVDPELAFNLPQGYSVTLSGSVRFGQALVGGSAGVNLRKQF
jgi:hypothetical protein